MSAFQESIFQYSENLAAGYGYNDPMAGWYFGEYENGQKSKNGDESIPYNDVGHYFNIIDEYAECAGVALSMQILLTCVRR